MAIRFVKGKTQKVLRCAIVGEHKSGKTTIVAEACKEYDGIIIDTEGSSSLIREDETGCYLVDTFNDTIEAYKEAIKKKPGLIAIDSISPVWKGWQDHWYAKYKGNRIPIHMWNIIKMPWRNLMRLIQTSQIPTIVTSRITYELDTNSDDWKVNKNEWAAQAEKNFLYEMDVVVKTFKEDDKYYGIIEGARIKKENLELAKLINCKFQNFSYKQHILPFALAGEIGDIKEFSDDREIDKGNEALEEKLHEELDLKEKQSLLKKIDKAEKKIAKMGVYDWQEDNIEATRKVALGEKGLTIENDVDVLRNYFDSIVRVGKAEKEKINGNA